MSSRHIFKIAILIYLVSLVLPYKGTWGAGLILGVFTSIISIGSLFEVIDEASTFGVGAIPKIGLLLLPFINIVFVWCALLFNKLSKPTHARSIVLYGGTVLALIFSIYGLTIDSGLYFLFFVWSLSLLLLSAATILKVKNA